MKVLAHPLRSRIVSQLRRSGPLTATALAALLGTNSGATSYHLRRLETVGLVADTGNGKGKERIWRAGSEQHSWTQSELVEDEDAVTRDEHFPLEYARLRTMPAYFAIFVVVAIGYGWCLQAKVSLAGPLVLEVISKSHAPKLQYVG